MWGGRIAIEIHGKNLHDFPRLVCDCANSFVQAAARPPAQRHIMTASQPPLTQSLRTWLQAYRPFLQFILPKKGSPMATRYGRHAADGTTEYHDSKASLIEAARNERRYARARLFGIVGLLIGGLLTYFAFHEFGAMALPKWTRFTGVVMGAGVGAFVLARLSHVLWNLILMAILAAIFFGIGSLIWQFV